jgi:hypothetical protein
MDGGAAGMIGHGKNVVGFGVAGYAPRVLPGPVGNVAPYMLRVLVGLGINNDIFETEILAGIHDPNGYFTTIGYENLSFQTLPR